MSWHEEGREWTEEDALQALDAFWGIKNRTAKLVDGMIDDGLTDEERRRRLEAIMGGIREMAEIRCQINRPKAGLKKLILALGLALAWIAVYVFS